MGERKPFETTRVTARWDGYNTSVWKNFREYFRGKHPLCITPGCGQATYYADHVVPVMQWIEQGGSPIDEGNCQALCWKCGNKKTGREGSSARRRREGKTPPGGANV